MIATDLSVLPALDCVSCLAQTPAETGRHRGKRIPQGGGDGLFIVSEIKPINFMRLE